MDNQKNENPIKIEVREDRDMSESEVEAVAYLLFQWWKREFEGITQSYFRGSKASLEKE